MKIQFPNVRESVETDLSYVSALMKVGGVLPKGAFLGRTIEVRLLRPRHHEPSPHLLNTITALPA